MASPVSSHPRWASLYDPYSLLLSVRASGSSERFEECMRDIAEALELEEDLASVEASIGDLIIAEEVDNMAGAGRTWDFRP